MSEAPRTGFFGHPIGLRTLFFTEMWERFSYYGLRPLLVLFMSAALFDGGFGLDRESAAAIVGIYAAGLYLASLPGGWIADRWLGLRKAITAGAVLITMGHMSIGLSGIFGAGRAGKIAFFAGLTLIVLGTGLLKPNISAIVGDLYPEGGARRDAGFSVYYMGINLGAFFGQIVTGYLGEQVGWHIGFGAAGVGMFFGLMWFVFNAKRTLGDIGTEIERDPDPAVQAKREFRVKQAVFAFALVVIALFAVAGSGVLTIDPVKLGLNLTYVLLGVAVIYFGYVLLLGGLDGDGRKRVLVILVLFVFAAIFWAAFEQAPTSLNLFAHDFTQRTYGGFEIPATWFQSINSFFIIILAPVAGMIWVALSKREGKGDLSIPSKFAMGLALAGVGFALMIIPANRIVASGGALLVSPMWLVMSYLFQTMGELSLSPVGLSAMTKLSPRKYLGRMMGVWFLASAIGNLIAGLLGGRVDPEALEQTPQLFTITAGFLFAAAILCALLIVPIRRMLAKSEV